jgi:hypothetical protein
MERNFYTDDFERLIRQKADQYKMYPSDQVWKGVYKSLHGRKRWRWAGLAVLLLGIATYTANWYYSDKPGKQIANNLQSSITAASESNPTAGIPSREDNTFNQPGEAANRQNGNNPASRHSALPFITSRTNSEDLLQDVSRPINSYSNEGSFVIQNNPEDITGATNIARNGSVEKITGEFNTIAGIEKNGLKEPVAEASNKALTLADAASESVLPTEKIQSVNWLQEYAVFQLTASKPERMALQLHFSPTVNYRKLRGSGYSASDVKNIPLSSNIMGDVDQYVKHKPALGFEIGANMVYRVSKRVNLKAGVQFNYSRYTIEAYEGHSEIATISLNTAFLADTVSRYSNIRNLSGFAKEDLANQYYQLSLPVGIDFKVLGAEKNLQLHVAGSIQPTYLLNRNSYLITTDYKSYMREPSLIRRWNVNGGLETYISYSTGTVRWQVGPQFRYQLLSSYSRKYPIREQLMEYGIKIGVSKTLH